MTTKIPVELSSTPSIVDNGDATAITIDSSENCTFTGTTTTTGYVIGNNTALYDDHSTLSAYSNTNGVYLNGKNAGWLSLSGDGTQRNNVRIYGQASSSGEIIQFKTANSERMRIDSSGNLLVGQTSVNYNAVGASLASIGTFRAAVDDGLVAALNRKTSNGAILNFYKDGTGIGSIDADGTNIAVNSQGGSGYLSCSGNIEYIWQPTVFRPNGNNVAALGAAGDRWTQLFAVTNVIDTSDRNEKQDEAAITEAEKRVAIAAKGLLKKFKFKDAVKEKGDDARIHFGIIAQDLQDAFNAEGLDASDYGMWCSDTWTDEKTGQEKTALGIRYSELLAFIIAGI